MKKLAVFACVSDSIRYFFTNIKSISYLVLQVYALMIFTNFLIDWIMNVNLFSYSLDPFVQEHTSLNTILIKAFVFLWGIFLAIPLKISISRHIVLNELFNFNFLNLIQQKRYFYCFLASLKMTVGIILISFLAILLFNLLLILLILILSLLMNGGAFPSVSEFSGSAQIVTIIIMAIFSSFVSFFIYCLFSIGFIYVSLFAALDKKAQFSESWKITKGHRFRIFWIMLLIGIVTTVPYIVIMFPLSYLATGSIVGQTPLLMPLSMFIGLYLSIFLTAAVAITYRSLIQQSEKSKNEVIPEPSVHI
ncbi:MAG: hypothetical protein KBD36_05260 [Alphaproteobacteria bacterium]|nr:hypothetical protein [Alphaproteobacteria bacterium]MBP9777233.1 hypothetical protein [Alphaproteobacteria bacterium]